MSVKENEFNHHKNRYEEINRCRSGDIAQYVTSVDIEGLLKTGGFVIEFLEGFICNNLEYNPLE